ncbi:MORN repeat protein [Candidatus Magnetobacterium bavaricum]|uniref:MORN repeat protein n=1 Tax=Candidatus Magnetobacterium bavaricum TaxID=29290 RepID=A0A0F3GN97_9BACT|nr:MORN repeat protein [Candidatus Magnetobacterium bavaricum]
MPLFGVVQMVTTGSSEDIAKGIFLIGLSVLWFNYFQNRKDWFNGGKGKTKEKKSQTQHDDTDIFNIVAITLVVICVVMVAVSLISQDKSKLNTSSFTTPPPTPVKSETQNKNIECIEGNCVNGYGTYSYSNGDKYVGEWKDSKRYGQGTYTLSNGSKYVGQWKDGEPHGQGTYTFSNGDKHVGQWKDGKRHGEGTYTFSDGRVLSGIWFDGELIKTPTPSPVDTAQQRKDTGCIEGNCVNGQGTYKFSDGDKYVGQWKDDKPHGQGTYTLSDGRVLSGIWSNGELVTEIKTPTTKPVESIPPITDNIKKDEHNYRFKDNGNGTLTDSKTGFMWTKNAKLIGRKDWKEALNYIASMNEGKGTFGYTDWRLPDREELESLVKGINVPYVWLNSQGFTNVQSGYYWSSTACAYVTDGAWLLSMDDGNVFAGDKSNGHYYVWPVRAAQ